MAIAANDKRLTPSCSHLFYPCWLFRLSLLVKVCQFADMVDRTLTRLPTNLTSICKQSWEKFIALYFEVNRFFIDQNRRFLAPQRDTTELCDQRFPITIPLDSNLEAFSWTVGCFNCGLVSCGHFRYGRFVLVCESFQQGCLHDPVQLSQAKDVLRQEVVLQQSVPPLHAEGRLSSACYSGPARF